MDDQALLQVALEEAKTGLREGGLPIGSVLANSAERSWLAVTICEFRLVIRPPTLKRYVFAMPAGGATGRN